MGKGGRSSKSYRTEGWWEKALAEKPTHILIQFGHNDMPGKGPERETDPDTTYTGNLARFVDEAIAAGAQPILVTSLTRRVFDAHGKLQNELAPYANAVRKLAEVKKVPLVDLHARSMEQVQQLGPQGTVALDALKQKEGGVSRDPTHLSPGGARLTAPLVAGELRRIGSDLASHLRDTP
jgi:lysophospholipase L1-like esterase